MLQSMRDLERTWNSKFNYPWLFLNDEPFSEEFKQKTREATKAEVRWGESAFTQVSTLHEGHNALTISHRDRA